MEERVYFLDYKYKSYEWLPGIGAMLDKSLCQATARLRRQRHARPPDLDLAHMPEFTVARVGAALQLLVGKVAELERLLVQKRVHVPRATEAIEIPRRVEGALRTRSRLPLHFVRIAAPISIAPIGTLYFEILFSPHPPLSIVLLTPMYDSYPPPLRSLCSPQQRAGATRWRCAVTSTAQFTT